MPIRPIAILVLAAFVLQSVFAGFGGQMQFCLGGGHDHALATQDHDPEACCAHQAGLPTPVAAEAGDDCPCSDLDVTILGDVLVVRAGSGFDLPVPIVPAPSWVVHPVPVSDAPSLTVPRVLADTVGSQWPAIALDTRLLV